MTENKSRRAVCEISTGEGRPPFPVAGNRPIHLQWPRLAPRFQAVLLAPQRRSDGRATVWSWREPAAAAPPTAAELAAVRRRLEVALAAAQKELAAADDEQQRGSAVELVAVMQAIIGRLIRLKDPQLAAYLGRTETGLMVHSWGATQPAVPLFPGETGYTVSGVILAGDAPAGGLEIVIENRKRVRLARATSDAAGAFLFKQIASGSYRVRVNSDRLDFPASGIDLVVDNQAVSGLVVRSRSLNVAMERAAHSPAELPLDPTTPAAAPAEKGAAPRLGAAGAGWLRRLGLIGVAGGLAFAAWVWLRPRTGSVVQASPAATSSSQLVVRTQSDAPVPAGGVATGFAVGSGAEADRAEGSYSRPASGGAKASVSGNTRETGRQQATAARVESNGGGAAGAPAGRGPNRATLAEAARIVSIEAGKAPGVLPQAQKPENGPRESAPGATTSADAPADAAAREVASPTSPDQAPANASGDPSAVAPADQAQDTAKEPASSRPGGAAEGSQGRAGAGATSNNAARGDSRSATGSGAAARTSAAVAGNGPTKPGTAGNGAGAANTNRPAAESPGESGRGTSPVAVDAGVVRRLEMRALLKAWDIRLMRDAVLPTTIVRVGETDRTAELRSTMLAELRRQMPGTLRRLALRCGIRIAFAGSATAAPAPARWIARTGSAAGASVFPGGAEVLLPAPGKFEPLALALRDETDRPLVEVTMEQSEEIRISAPVGAVTWFWVEAEGDPEDAKLTAGPGQSSRIGWRLAPNQPLPPPGGRADRPGEPELRAEVPLPPIVPAGGNLVLTLVDRVTGWAAVGEIRVPDDSSSRGR